MMPFRETYENQNTYFLPKMLFSLNSDFYLKDNERVNMIQYISILQVKQIDLVSLQINSKFVHALSEPKNIFALEQKATVSSFVTNVAFLLGHPVNVMIINLKLQD